MKKGLMFLILISVFACSKTPLNSPPQEPTASGPNTPYVPGTDRHIVCYKYTRYCDDIYKESCIGYVDTALSMLVEKPECDAFYNEIPSRNIW